MAQTGALSRDQTHVLPDGRTLVWSEYGTTDGAAVFYFHGIPGSRIDGRVVADVIAAAGLRVIAADRPGFGRSTYAGKRSYSGWVADVESLADALGVDRFSILAYSCGGPYALAAAAALPDRVARVAIVSGVATAEMPGYRHGLCQTDRVMTWLAPRAPWLAKPLVARSLKLARLRPARFLNEACRDFKAAADRSLINAGFGSLMPELFLEAGRDGPAGIVEDFAVWAARPACSFTARGVQCGSGTVRTTVLSRFPIAAG